MKEGWEYIKLEECCKELFAGGDVPKPDVSKNKTNHFSVPIYTNGVENEGLYGYTNKSRVSEPAVTISARGTIGATFRRYNPFFPAIRLITAVPKNDLLIIDYLFYALKTLTVGNSGTSIPQLTIPNIKNIVLPIPPLSEQQSIVDYLDSAFAKIDAMKANAEKALNEAKALFQASLKEMLEPKEGWEEKTLGDVCEINSILVDPKDIQFKDLLHVGGANIVSKTGELIELKTAAEEKLTSGKYIFNEKDVLYNKIRPYLIKVSRPYFSGLCSADIYPLSSKEGMTRDFLYYILVSRDFTDYAIMNSARAGMPKLNRQALFAYKCKTPPISDQQTIVNTLDSLKSKVDRLQSNFDKISQECDALKQAILRQVFE